MSEVENAVEAEVVEAEVAVEVEVVEAEVAEEATEVATEEATEEPTEEERKAADLERRSAAVDIAVRGVDEKKRTVSIAVSSELPVERSFGKEILVHESNAIDMAFLSSGRAPLLLDHDMERQIGVIDSVGLDADRVL